MTAATTQVLLSLAASSSSRVSSHLASLGLQDKLQEVLGQRLEEEVVAAVHTLARQTMDGLVVPGGQVVDVVSLVADCLYPGRPGDGPDSGRG